MKQKGFTLIELVFIICIIGIVVVMVIPALECVSPGGDAVVESNPSSVVTVPKTVKIESL